MSKGTYPKMILSQVAVYSDLPRGLLLGSPPDFHCHLENPARPRRLNWMPCPTRQDLPVWVKEICQVCGLNGA